MLPQFVRRQILGLLEMGAGICNQCPFITSILIFYFSLLVITNMIEFGESPTLLSWTVLAVTSGGGGEMDGKQRDPLKEEGKKSHHPFWVFHE